MDGRKDERMKFELLSLPLLKIFEMRAQQASSLDSIQMMELEPRVFDSYSSKMVEWRDDGVSEDEGMTKSKIRRDENYVGSVWVK